MPLSGIPKANPPRIRIKGVKRTLRKLASKALESPGLRQVNKAARLNPVLFAGASIGLRYLLGDGLVQKMEGGSWDVRRSVIFGLFGFAYGSTVRRTSSISDAVSFSCFRVVPIKNLHDPGWLWRVQYPVPSFCAPRVALGHCYI
uniref:Uncharacterized protein n=1 Tax=Lotharella globosa TaxID=91324 RepID=A0A7S3YJ99_9EUKA